MTVSRFSLRDLPVLLRLQRRGLWSDPQLHLTGMPSLTLSVLGSPFRWWGSSTTTYVTGASNGGIVQTRMRPGRPVQDVVFVSPALDHGNGTASAWKALLSHCVHVAADLLVHAIFVRVLEADTEADTLFQQAGFTPFAQERVYRLQGLRDRQNLASPTEGKMVRDLAFSDDLTAERLRSSITPRPVLLAEGGGSCLDASPLWLAPPYGRSLVCLRDSEVIGVLTGQTGPSGHCFRLWGSFQNDKEVHALMQRGLSLVEPESRRAVYCIIRDYQAGVSSALADMGFQQQACWSCLVKHTAVRSREPARRSWRALEARPEPSVPGAVPTHVE